ncbi:hypothetical protein D3C87_1374130 [compost metagenome]
MLRAERGEPGRQPQHRHAGRAGHRQLDVPLALHHVFRGLGAGHQQALHLLCVLLAGNGQPQRARFAHEQLLAEKALELRHLPADGALGEMEFSGRAREAAVAHGRFEGDQAGQGRQGCDAHGGTKTWRQEPP